ncbi:glycosyltransferase 87 family protein [Jatrophihabitans sp. YIM 134969]
MTPRGYRWALGATLSAYLALTAVLFQSTLAHRDVVWYCASVLLAGGAVLLLRRCDLDERATVLLVIGFGVALQCAAIAHPPLTSSDMFRYVWDGRVQLHGIDPYRYPPSAPQLSSLRDNFLFGPDACGNRFLGGCTAINRPTVNTIYPPVAEAGFVVLNLLSFGGTLSYQVYAALGTVAVAVLLWRMLARDGRPLWAVALWAWCPVVVTEYGNNAHIDWLAVLLSLLAVRAATAGHDTRAGAWIGAATAVKLYPALLLAALARRRPWVVVPAALGVVVLSYVPHVVAVGKAVIGYLPGYLDEEGYASGGRLKLIGVLVPHPADTVVGALVLVAVALWAFWRTDPDNPARTGVVVVGAAFLVATPTYGWYAGLLIALAVVARRYEWVLVALVPTIAAYVDADLLRSRWPATLMYLVAGLAVAAVSWSARRSRSAERHPADARVTA